MNDKNEITERVCQLIDLNKIIFSCTSDKLQDIFGTEWHINFLGENFANNANLYQFIEKIKNGKDKLKIEKLAEVLLHTNQDAAALLLMPEVKDLVDLSFCDPRNGHVKTFSFGDTNPEDKIEEVKDKNSYSQAYNMEADPRGFCFLLNNYFTKGTYKEMQRFRNIFHQLNFDVIMRKNLDAKDIFKELLLLSKSDKLKSHCAFVFMSISHGSPNGEIYGADLNTIRIKTLLDMFNNANCPDLLKKPRIFFFNCCRGIIKSDKVEELSGSSLLVMDKSISGITKESDTFICYSVLEGYTAPVNWRNGTPFGKALADSFVERAHGRDLSYLISIANKKLEEQNEKVTEFIQRGGRTVYFG